MSQVTFFQLCPLTDCIEVKMSVAPIPIVRGYVIPVTVDSCVNRFSLI